MKSPLAFLPVLAALLLGGCATTYDFRVDAISDPELIQAVGQSYVLIPADPDTNTNDLRFQESARYAEAALATEGYYRVGSPADAEIIVTLDAGVSDPVTVSRRVSDPVYANVGGYYRTTLRPVSVDGSVRYVPYTVWQPPQTRYMGTIDRSESLTVYPKRFAMTAFAKDSSGASVNALPQLWSVVVTNTNTSSDLRAYLPMLAAAAARHIGGNTGREIRVTLKADDPTVELIRQSY